MKNKLKKFVTKYFSSFAFFYSYLRNRIFIAFFLSALVSFFDGLGLSMFFPLLQSVDDTERSNDELGSLKIIPETFEKLGMDMSLFTVLVTICVFFLLKGCAKYLSSVYMVYLMQKFIRDMRLKLLDLLNRMSFKSFITSDIGRIQNTVTGEVGRVSGAFSAYLNTVQQAVMVAIYVGFAFLLDWRFALLVAIGGLLTNFLFQIIYKKTKEASRKLTRTSSNFQGQVIQHVSHFKYLKATGSLGEYGNKLRSTILRIEDARRRIGILNSISDAAREPLVVLVVALVIWVQIRYFNGAIGTILISLLFFYRALISLMAMQQSWNAFMSNSGSLENMLDFEHILQSSVDRDGKTLFLGFKERIHLENINFSYGSTPILRDINLVIERNRTIAFVGESGSGKTTLVSLISGLLPEDKGIFTIDGIPVKELKKESYQKKIGYVSQDPVVFNDTIYNNVTFWAPSTPENTQKFEKSIRQASLWEFLESLPQKEGTFLGNNGINLSGGQKQRISIARELFKNIDILMLDEATSALDSETEKEIQESIEALKGKYTLLIVAHRLSTIKNADCIVLMDQGRIVDMGSFNRLQEKQERFKKMVELQDL